MITLPTFITLLRFPLALAFFQENPAYRAAAIVLAMITDFLDGYLARRYKKISRIGTTVDPIADKVFVLCALAAMLQEGRLMPWEALTMLSRDFSVLAFGCYLSFKGTLAEYQFRSIWSGKIMTTLQFFVLMGLIFDMPIPSFIFFLFILIGCSALIELYLERKKVTSA